MCKGEEEEFEEEKELIIITHTSSIMSTPCRGRSYIYSTALPLPIVAAAQTALAVSSRCEMILA